MADNVTKKIDITAAERQYVLRALDMLSKSLQRAIGSNAGDVDINRMRTAQIDEVRAIEAKVRS